jgi:pimeloyl-ACP methyl ester carboxylesterase
LYRDPRVGRFEACHHLLVPLLDANGARLSYTVSGKGPAVLLLQGAGVVGEGWRPQIDALGGEFTVIAPDNRGFGGSTLGTGPLTIEAMAADALAIVDALGIHAFHLGGHSMGGLIAQQIALAQPSRVLSLALMCTFAHGRQAAAMSLPMIMTAIRMRFGTRAMRRRAFMQLVMPEKYLAGIDQTALAEQLRPLFGYDLASQPSFVMQQVRAMANFDARRRLSELSRIPVIVVSATEDRIARPEYGRELDDLIGTSRYVEIRNAGHGVTIQCADQINELLLANFDTSVPRLLGTQPVSIP